jgi:predicted esterase
MNKELTISYKAPYVTWSTLSAQTRLCWLVLHGYGQLASFFIKKFEVLNPDEHYVVAPQGLSKFYLEGFSGRVGATWMTRENRLTDIDNYIAYLDAIFAAELDQLPDACALVVLGFSQGAATLSRWLQVARPSVRAVVLWAGELAPEVQALIDDYWQAQHLIFIHGTQDELVSRELVDKHLEKLAHINLQAEFISYNGGHKVDTGVVKQLAEKLTKNR